MTMETAQEAAAFEPQITTFVCQYCADMAADTAGLLRASYPANIKIVRFPCTGRLDVLHILTAFEHGADGVCVMGCPEGNCHHINGNLRASARVEYARKLLDELGIGGQRLAMYMLLASQGDQFARYATEITEKIRGLGPSPMNRPAGGS